MSKNVLIEFDIKKAFQHVASNPALGKKLFYSFSEVMERYSVSDSTDFVHLNELIKRGSTNVGDYDVSINLENKSHLEMMCNR